MLIDFVIALFLSAIAVLGLIRLNQETVNLNTEAREISVAGLAADNLVARLRLEAFDEGGEGVVTTSFDCQQVSSAVATRWCNEVARSGLEPPYRVCTGVQSPLRQLVVTWADQPCGATGSRRVIRDVTRWH